MSQIAAIILAAGKGTRMKSDKPKVVFELAGKPMINRVVQTALDAGSNRIVCVVGYKKEVVLDTVPANPVISYVEQVEQNGTGHAVIVTQDELKDFKGTVFILCGDVPLLRHSTLSMMLKHHKASKASCTVLTAKMDDAQRYGRIVRNNMGNVQRIVEFKDASESEKEINEINTGIYCFNAEDMYDALASIDCANNQNEYYLTDTLEILNNKNKIVTSCLLDDMVEASGVNSKEQLSILEKEFYSRKENSEV